MNVFKSVFRFYVDGFRSQSRTSRKLWLIILLKLTVMFVILKLFFFRGYFKANGVVTEEQKSEFVMEKLISK